MTGFFGKLPAAGDFVARGLPQGVRPVLDRWLSRYIAAAAARPGEWPEAGLLAVITGPYGPLALALIASHDAARRPFPLAACASGASDRTGHESWAAAVVPLLTAARDEQQDADALFGALGAVPTLKPADAPFAPPCLWHTEASEADEGDPKHFLEELFPETGVEVAP